MTTHTLEVDLDRAPAERWLGLGAHRAAVHELVALYTRDLGGLDVFRDALPAYRAAYISEDHAAEIDAIAELVDVDPLALLLVNGYYDAFKQLMGCTAFAVEGPNGPLHARNLDWLTERSALSRHTLHVRFVRSGRPIFEAVTWPGFVGTLSGMAPGRFSVTLNAAISDEPAELAPPIGLVLRELLERADYATAVAELRDRAISCDCLLLVVGTRPGEMCVVERTPGHAAVRGPSEGVIVVTNDYRVLDAADWTTAGANTLQLTSCGRHDRASMRALAERPATEEACYAILDDAGVKMDITVQQMVACAGAGWLVARGTSAT